jgi:hypothetical protein
MRKAVLAMTIPALAACAMARVAWDKADATPELVSADSADCRRLVADEMWRLGWERNWPPAFYDPLFMPPYYRGRRAFWLEFPRSLERERALFEFCMHSKGYRLEALPDY